MSRSAIPDRLLYYWRDYIAAHGFPPTMREARDALDLASTSSVRYHLEKCVERGLMRHVGAGLSRGYVLANPTAEPTDRVALTRSPHRCRVPGCGLIIDYAVLRADQSTADPAVEAAMQYDGLCRLHAIIMLRFLALDGISSPMSLHFADPCQEFA